MKYCKKCGAQLNDNAAFCVKCGANVFHTESQNSQDEPKNLRMQPAGEPEYAAGSDNHNQNKSKFPVTIVVIAVVVIIAAVIAAAFLKKDEDKNAAESIQNSAAAEDTTEIPADASPEAEKSAKAEPPVSAKNETVAVEAEITAEKPETKTSATVELSEAESLAERLAAVEKAVGELEASEESAAADISESLAAVERDVDALAKKQEYEEYSEYSEGELTYYNPFYGIWVGASKDESEAWTIADRVSKRGFAGDVYVSSRWANLNSETWYCIVAGRYDTEAEAKAALPAVKEVYPDAYIKYSGMCIATPW